jgi:hypothetical protein
MPAARECEIALRIRLASKRLSVRRHLQSHRHARALRQRKQPVHRHRDVFHGVERGDRLVVVARGQRFEQVDHLLRLVAHAAREQGGVRVRTRPGQQLAQAGHVPDVVAHVVQQLLEAAVVQRRVGGHDHSTAAQNM